MNDQSKDALVMEHAALTLDEMRGALERSEFALHQANLTVTAQATIVQSQDGEIAALTAEVTHLAEKLAERDALLADIEFVITGAAPGSKLGSLLVRIHDFQRSAAAPQPVDAAQAVPETASAILKALRGNGYARYLISVSIEQIDVALAAAPIAQPTDTTKGA